MSRLTAAIILFALTAGAVFFFIMPQWQMVTATRSAIGELEALHRELLELAASRDALMTAYNAIPEADLEKLRAITPASRETSSVLADFEQLAVEHTLSLDQVDFIAQKDASTVALPKAGAYGTIPVSLRLRGPYEGFREFLAALERNLRLVDVDEFAITASQIGQSPVTLKGVIYYRR